MALKYLVDLDLGQNEIQNFALQNLGTNPSGVSGQLIYNTALGSVMVSDGTSWHRVGLSADGTTITETNGVIAVGTIAIGNVSGLQTALNGKVDDSQVLTNVPAGAVFTDTTYSVQDGELSEANFTANLRDKLNAIEDGATNTADPAITTNGTLPSLASGISAAEVRSLIGAGVSSFDGTWTSLSGKPTTFTPSAHTHDIGEINGLQVELDRKAPLASPALTGTPTVPTAPAGTNTTQIASTAFVSTAVANLVDAAPGALDTLNELAAAIGDDSNFAGTIAGQIGDKLNSADYTAADVLAKIKTVDGAGSGLDADLLDGQSSAYYRNYNNLTNTPAIPKFVSIVVTGTGALTALPLNLGGYANIQIVELATNSVVLTDIIQDGAGSFQAHLPVGDFRVIAVGS